MSYIQTALWGLVVGLADILPISGSAHIAFLEKIFGQQSGNPDQRLFYALLDFALLIAILLTYRHEAMALLRALHSSFGKNSSHKKSPTGRADQRLLLMLFIGLLPLVLEVFLQRWTAWLYVKPLFWAVALIFSGLFLFLCEYLSRGTKDEKQIRIGDAFFVGLAQAVSVLPGLSRTGLTVASGYARGFKPAFSLQYAFLLAVPFLFGSGVIKTVQALQAGVMAALLPAYLVGMAACILTALAAMNFLQYMLRKKKLYIFAFYCWAAAAFSLFLFLIT